MNLTPKTGLGYGAALGALLTVVMSIGAVAKLAGGASWETLEWMGTVALVISFPLSQLLDTLGGWSAYVAIFVAPVVNWSLIGLLIGIVGAAVGRVMAMRS